MYEFMPDQDTIATPPKPPTSVPSRKHDNPAPTPPEPPRLPARPDVS